METTTRPLKNSTTRTFDTVKGELDYATLSDLVAPKLMALLDDITLGKYAALPINEELIQTFHFRIIGGLMPQIAGKWRNGAVQVGNHLPPEPFEVPMYMRNFVDTLAARLETSTSLPLQVEALAYTEGEFLHIHPFQDFNGRTVRALLRELLIRLDMPPIDTYVERDTVRFSLYQNALAEYDNHNIAPLVDFWFDRFNQSL